MERNLRHTNKSETTQCPHNNTGYCKFNDHCIYQHYYSICDKSICRDNECKKRHPKTCRNGESCKFRIRNSCAYKHESCNQSKNKEISVFTDKIESIEKEVKSLHTEISMLKTAVKLKEGQLKEKSVDILEMKKKIDLLESEGENLKTTIHKEKAQNDKLKTLLLSKDKRIKILDKKLSDIEKYNNDKPVDQNEDTEIQNNKHTNSCPYCGKFFDNKSNLKEHIINHSGPNILHFKCSESGESDWETDDE